MNKAGERKLELMEERGSVCEWCRINPATEAHHCLFKRQKGNLLLDVKENLMLLCPGCHSKASFALKRIFWEIQVRRYGREHMIQWLTELPMRSKESFE